MAKQTISVSWMYVYLSHYVHPTGGWTYYFCFFHRPASGVTLGFRSFQGKVFMFTKFGMGVYWVISLHGITFGEDYSIYN